MPKYIIIHTTHEGCYDCKQIEHSGVKITPITVNTPKLFFFDSKLQAGEFFTEYINDVDVIDERCKRGVEIDHQDFCTCGIIEMDEDSEQPIFFYNKKNQIFLLETTAQLYIIPESLKIDLNNLSVSHRIFKRRKSLAREQKQTYIELGRLLCEDCKPATKDEPSDTESDSDNDTKI
jgi:hypothetical protein